MVWFSEDVLTTEMIFENYLSRLRHVPLEEGEEERRAAAVAAATGDKEEAVSPALQVAVVVRALGRSLPACRRVRLRADRLDWDVTV